MSAKQGLKIRVGNVNESGLLRKDELLVEVECWKWYAELKDVELNKLSAA